MNASEKYNDKSAYSSFKQWLYEKLNYFNILPVEYKIENLPIWTHAIVTNSVNSFDYLDSIIPKGNNCFNAPYNQGLTIKGLFLLYESWSGIVREVEFDNHIAVFKDSEYTEVDDYTWWESVEDGDIIFGVYIHEIEGDSQGNKVSEKEYAMLFENPIHLNDLPEEEL